MSTQTKLIAINLKHFYQRKGCWFYYLILFFVILPPFFAFTGFSHDADGFHLSAGEPKIILLSMLFLSFFLNMLGGMLAGDLVRSVAARTFSTCMPGYKRLPAITIAIMGLVVNVGYTALVMLGASHLFYSIVLIFSLGIFVYVNMAIVVLRSLNPTAFFGLFGCMGFYGFIAGVPFTEVLFYYLEANSLWLSAVLLAVSWWRLKRINVVRISEKLCDVPTMDLFSMWNPEKVKRVAEYRIAMRNDRFGLGIVTLLEKMMHSSSVRAIKHGFGLALVGCGANTINLRVMLIVWLLLIMFISYMPIIGGFAARIMLFIVPIFSVMQLANATRLPLLSGCGRKQRFQGALIAGIVYISIVTVLLLLMVLLTVVLDTFMPFFTIPFGKGIVLDFKPFRFSYIMIVFFTMPIVYAFSVISPRVGVIASITVFYLSIGAIVADKILRSEYGYAIASYPVLILLPLILLCGVSYLMIRRHFLKADFKFAR